MRFERIVRQIKYDIRRSQPQSREHDYISEIHQQIEATEY